MSALQVAPLEGSPRRAGFPWCLNPRDLGALIERGHLVRKRGDHTGSAEAFGAASVIEAQHVGISLELVRELRALDRLDQADAVLTDLFHRNPRELGARIERGHLLRKRGDHTGSAEAFEAAD